MFCYALLFCFPGFFVLLCTSVLFARVFCFVMCICLLHRVSSLLQFCWKVLSFHISSGFSDNDLAAEFYILVIRNCQISCSNLKTCRIFSQVLPWSLPVYAGIITFFKGNAWYCFWYKQMLKRVSTGNDHHIVKFLKFAHTCT